MKPTIDECIQELDDAYEDYSKADRGAYLALRRYLKDPTPGNRTEFFDAGHASTETHDALKDVSLKAIIRLTLDGLLS